MFVNTFFLVFHICVCDMICGGGVFQKFCVSRLNCLLAFVCMCVCVCDGVGTRSVCKCVSDWWSRRMFQVCVCVEHVLVVTVRQR